MSQPGRSYPLIHPIHKPHLIAIYLLIISITSLLAWNIYNTFEVFILTTANRLTAIVYHHPLASNAADDSSVIEITTHPDLKLLVKYPDGSKAGDTADDIRFTGAKNTTVKEVLVFKESAYTSSSGSIWQLTTTTPPVGNYLLTFTTKKSGSYPLIINVIGRNGVYTKRIEKTISLDSRQKQQLYLRFHKDVIYRTALKKRFQISDLNLIKRKSQ